MPVSPEILTQLRQNDSTLVHLDLTFQFDVHFNESTHTWVSTTHEQDRLTDTDIVALSEALSQNTYLKSINLNKNKVGALGIGVLATKRLEKLSLGQNGLNSECIDALMLHETLISLDVPGNSLEDQDIAKLGQLASLSSLDVSENKIGPLFMDAIASNTTLEKLSIRNSRYGLEYPAYVMMLPVCLAALGTNKTLEYLDLSDNRIELRGFDVFSRHSTIQELNLQECNFFIGNALLPVSFSRAIALVAQLPRLTRLNIRALGTKRGGDTDEAIVSLAKLPLQYMDVSEMEISAMGAKALASSTTLTTLIASKNDIGPYGLLALAKNTSITHLDLSHNDMKTHPYYKPEIQQRNQVDVDNTLLHEYPKEIISTVMTAFEQNNTLQILNLSHQRMPCLFAKEIQDRNRNIPPGLVMLLLRAIKPARKKSAATAATNGDCVLENMDLLRNIGTFIVEPRFSNQPYLRAQSIFNQLNHNIEPPSKRRKIDTSEISCPSSNSP
ncbi:MAG: hypothetical protein P1U36_00990 [Legionellaceae bacterium]|nr:hypothetical protein [Legionellaceae bacterium]